MATPSALDSFRSLADHAPVMLWITGTDGSREWVNAAWLDFTGRTELHELGRGWLDAVHEEDRPLVEAAEAHALRSHEPYSCEVRLRRADGEWRRLVLRARPRAADGGFAGFVGSAEDVTEARRAAERLNTQERAGRALAERAEEAAARFRQLADAMPQMVWTARPEGTVDYCNRRFQEVTGLAPGDPPPNPWPLLAHDEDVAGLLAAWRAAVRTASEFEVQARLRDGRGRFRWHLVRGVPVRGIERAVERWFGTCTDIEEQKRTEAALREAIRLKDEFLGVVSHELRTPLNAILSWSYLLEAQGVACPSFPRAVESIRRNAEVQRQLVEELLDVSRVTTGNLRLDLQRVTLGAVLQEALAAVRGAAEARGVALVVEVDPAVTVWGEATRLRTVAWHLLSNAVKFTSRGGRVSLAVRREGDVACLQVRDDGIGIDPAFLPHVFERFRQADASSTRRYGGLGLGLALVRALVEAHGGEVRAESPGVGQGATFTALFPLAPALEPAPASPPAPSLHRRLAGVRVLVVDDHADSRDSVQELLEGEGAVVATAEGAPEALAWLSEQPADVLLIDLAMPGQDGLSLLAAVRRLGTDRGGVPALALTAFADAADRRATLQAGFQGHLAKPVQPEQLVAEIAALTRRH